MSQEIVDAVRVLGREKGISEEKLMIALEDALLSAYKKQPGAARYARVRMDRDSGPTAGRKVRFPVYWRPMDSREDGPELGPNADTPARRVRRGPPM